MFVSPKLARLGVAATIATFGLVNTLTFWWWTGWNPTDVQIAVWVLLMAAWVFFATIVSWAYMEGRNRK